MPARSLNTFLALVCLLLVASTVGGQSGPTQGKSSQSKPTRSRPPEFKPGQFQGIFFGDISTALRGKFPREAQTAVVQARSSAAATAGSVNATTDLGAAEGAMPWKDLISPNSLEDLVKGSKLRLDRIVTTPAAFAGGGFQEARKEFSLQALVFAIVEDYPGDVRWKSSAAAARESMTRVAANTKVGSRQVYDEAKKRLLDLEDLLNGSTLTAESRSEVEWQRLIDRGSLMQLLEWSQQEFIAPQSASAAQFQANKSELQRYAELVAVLGRISIVEGMPDAEDSDYQSYAGEMMAQAKQIVMAVQTDNAELARQASGKLGQSCSTCHENFR